MRSLAEAMPCLVSDPSRFRNEQVGDRAECGTRVVVGRQNLGERQDQLLKIHGEGSQVTLFSIESERCGKHGRSHRKVPHRESSFLSRATKADSLIVHRPHTEIRLLALEFFGQKV